MSALTETEIIDAVTNAIGNPSTDEYSLAAKQDALRRALTEYSKYKPIRRIGVFQTVADQQQYDIGSSYSYLVGITNVFYGSNSEDLTGYYGNTGIWFDQLALGNLDTLNNESLRVIDNQAISVAQDALRFDYEMLDDNIVALMPTPEDARNVYFMYTLIKAVDDLRESEYQDIVDFTVIISAQDLGAIRNKILQYNDPQTGFVMFQSGNFLKEVAKAANERVTKSLGVGTLAIHG